MLLIEQVRFGALAKGDPHPWLPEPVAVPIDAGEIAETTVLRELREEAGATVGADALRRVARHYPSFGVLTSFVALCDLPCGAAGSHGLAAEHEDIRGHPVGFDAPMAMVASGDAANASQIGTAQWLSPGRDRLRG